MFNPPSAAPPAYSVSCGTSLKLNAAFATSLRWPDAGLRRTAVEPRTTTWAVLEGAIVRVVGLNLHNILVAATK